MNIKCLALLVQWWVPDKWFRAGHEPWQWGSMAGGRTRTQAGPSCSGHHPLHCPVCDVSHPALFCLPKV